MPVADDDRQLSMFPRDDPVRELLFNVIKTQAEGIRMLSAVAAGYQMELKEALAQGFHLKPLDDLPSAPERDGYGPSNSKHRTFRGFALDLQRLERIVRRDNHLEHDDAVTKEMLYAAGAPMPRTIWNTMKGYALRSDQWPPSTWDASEDRTWHSPHKNRRRGKF